MPDKEGEVVATAPPWTTDAAEGKKNGEKRKGGKMDQDSAL